MIRRYFTVSLLSRAPVRARFDRESEPADRFSTSAGLELR
jgi:hypothetical protein